MKSERIVSKWYDITGEKCLKFYRKSQNNEIIQLSKLVEKIAPKAEILDAGCGDGTPAAKFLSSKGYKVIGIDISKKLINKAQKNIPHAKFKRMSLYNINFQPKRFDAIISFFAILHLEKNKVNHVFKAFHKILKDGGYLFFSVNQGKEEGYFEFFGKKVFFSAFSKKEIKEILRRNNFELVWKKDFFFNKKDSKENQLYYLAKKI